MEDLYEYGAFTVIYRQDGRMRVEKSGLLDRGIYNCLEFNHRLMQIFQYGWEMLAIISLHSGDRHRLTEDYFFRRKKGWKKHMQGEA
jgi:hypothetical protein